MKIYKLIYDGKETAFTNDPIVLQVYIHNRELDISKCNIEKIKIKPGRFFNEDLYLEEWMGHIVTREEKYLISDDYLTTYHSNIMRKQRDIDSFIVSIKYKYGECSDEYIHSVKKINKEKGKLIANHIKDFDKGLRSYIEYCLYGSSYIEDLKINNVRRMNN